MTDSQTKLEYADCDLHDFGDVMAPCTCGMSLKGAEELNRNRQRRQMSEITPHEGESATEYIGRKFARIPNSFRKPITQKPPQPAASDAQPEPLLEAADAMLRAIVGNKLAGREAWDAATTYRALRNPAVTEGENEC